MYDESTTPGTMTTGMTDTCCGTGELVRRGVRMHTMTMYINVNKLCHPLLLDCAFTALPSWLQMRCATAAGVP
jgi:hypothetical protein